jgi:hypothetical protein
MGLFISGTVFRLSVSGIYFVMVSLDCIIISMFSNLVAHTFV